MSDIATPPPPPPSQSSSPSHGIIMARNIITGVLTTIVGAAALYFLKFNKSNDSSEASMLLMKEATTNAWKSYVASENVFNNNLNTYLANYSINGFDHFKEASLGEFEHFKTDLERIKDTKNIDPSLISMLEQRKKNNDESESKYKTYLENYDMINKTVGDSIDRNTKLNTESQRFTNEKKERDQVFENEIEELCKALTSKYSYPFAKTDLTIYKPVEQNTQTTNTTTTNTTTNNSNNNSGTDASENNNSDSRMLVGKWVNGTNVLYQEENGKLYYYYGNGDSTYGSWELYNNQVYHYSNQYYGAGHRWIYKIDNLTSSALSITMVDSPYYRYNFVKSN